MSRPDPERYPLIPWPRSIDTRPGQAPPGTAPIVERDARLGPEAFTLEVSERAINVLAGDDQGVRHAQRALRQLTREDGSARGAPNSQQAADFLAGKFQLGYRPWGIGNPHPSASLARPIREFSLTASGGGSKYPAKHTTDVAGAVDFDALLNEMVEGFDTEKQKPAVTKAALAFNELLPAIPLWERALNSPVNDQARVTGWPPLTDEIFKNSSADNPVSILILDGTLKAK